MPIQRKLDLRFTLRILSHKVFGKLCGGWEIAQKLLKTIQHKLGVVKVARIALDDKLPPALGAEKGHDEVPDGQVL